MVMEYKNEEVKRETILYKIYLANTCLVRFSKHSKKDIYISG